MDDFDFNKLTEELADDEGIASAIHEMRHREEVHEDSCVVCYLARHINGIDMVFDSFDLEEMLDLADHLTPTAIATISSVISHLANLIQFAAEGDIECNHELGD